METAELLVYIVIAVVVGAFLIVVIKSNKTEDQYRDYVKVFKNEEPDIFKVDAYDFATELAKRWEDCRFGIDNATYSVFVKDEAVINRSFIVEELLRADKCDSIDCRNRSNGFIFGGPITTPKIINIRCFNNSLIVR